MAIQDDWLTAVHMHPAPADTVIGLPGPPSAPIDSVVGWIA